MTQGTSAAKSKGVPVLTVDRKLNSQPCSDYVSCLGSDFTEQGKRAADQMIDVTGGKGKVAILLGASGNTVTTERTGQRRRATSAASRTTSHRVRPV